MAITILILLLTKGILAVTAVDDCPNQNTSITGCCNTAKFFFTFGRNPAGKLPSGIYLLKNFCGKNCINAEAYCDTSSGGGGWLVVQRRQDGSIDFNRTWQEYEDGFGKLTGEFWYGLRALHCLTGQGGWELRMDIKLANGTNIFLQYKQFKVASANDKYKLTVGGFQGSAGDEMGYQNGMSFTTKDRDNDQWDKNCALSNNGVPHGGWWYKSCVWSIRPNNIYKALNGNGIHFNSKWHSVTFIETKIRPHNCNI